MNQKQGKITKKINQVFLIEISKLSRLVNIIEDKYKNSGMGVTSKYWIILKNGKKLSASNLEHILEQDNTIKNPIINLNIEFENTDKDNLNKCSIEYNKYKSFTEVSIDTTNLKWANELFAEIEEQIERTLATSIIDKKKDTFTTVAIFISFISVFSIFILLMTSMQVPSKKLKDTNYLSKSDIESLYILSDNVKTIDDKINMLYELQKSQLRNLAETKTPSIMDFIKKIDLRTSLLFLPFIIIFMVFIYLINYCYPGSLFIWGDFEEYYKNLQNKRKMIWSGIIIALAVGIIGNLFVFAFSNLFRT